MDELSYNDALMTGIELTAYRTEILRNLGAGTYPGRLDALVWGKSGAPAHLQALITMDDGQKVRIAAYHQDNRRGGQPYRGFREFQPGAFVNVVITIGSRGGVQATLEKRD